MGTEGAHRPHRALVLHVSGHPSSSRTFLCLTTTTAASIMAHDGRHTQHLWHLVTATNRTQQENMKSADV